MDKTTVLICMCVLLLISQSSQQRIGTEGYYMSISSLTRQQQVREALNKITPNFVINDIMYTKGTDYKITNTNVKIMYLNGKQQIQVPKAETVKVSGGLIQFQYTFNYTNGKGTTGYAIGTVTTDSFNYTKQILFNTSSELIWKLVNGKQGVVPITITNDLKVRRMDPFNEDDLKAIQDMLGKVDSGVKPSNMKTQLISQFNSLIPKALNQSLNSQAVTPQVRYTFQHPTKGALNMTILHTVYQFHTTKQLGYDALFETEIKDWPQPVCEGIDVPSRHLSWQYYGGIQNIHLVCLYQQVVQYMQKKQWLDTNLDPTWDCNAFQFYAGDLYDLINSLGNRVYARELLQGECLAQKQNLVIKHEVDTSKDVLSLFVTYECKARSRTKTGDAVDILDFRADVVFSIKLGAKQRSLSFTIDDAKIKDMKFKPVGQFYVGDVDLAMFKANEVIKNLKGTKVFGTGFPIIPLQYPNVQVLSYVQNCDGRCILYSDKSITNIPISQQNQ